MKEKYKYKNGVFLARMQPMHKAHLEIINIALRECEKVTIILGSSNKRDMLRNPFTLEKRKNWLALSLPYEVWFNDRIKIFEIPDWSLENDTNETSLWGRYFYYNVVSRIGSKRFTIYYSDSPDIIKNWFHETEVEEYITLRLLDRGKMYDGLSATKIREAILKMDLDYLNKYLPEPVLKDVEYLNEYYKKVVSHPKDDFSME